MLSRHAAKQRHTELHVGPIHAAAVDVLPPAAVKRIGDVLALSQRTPVLVSREEVVRVATTIASAKHELMFSTVLMDRQQYQLVFLRQWIGHLGARARNVLLIGATEATCAVVRRAALACFVDGASPKQNGKQNGFGSQVVTKWWYAMVLSQAGFHLLFSDPDIVWLRDPFQHWDRSFDLQANSPLQPRLQPHATQAAAPYQPRQQPHATQAAGPCNPGCSPLPSTRTTARLTGTPHCSFAPWAPRVSRTSAAPT